ncbi:phosphoribulokinase [Nevskia soli]|uniref:phosphoribulokinase n=1 Tax=Nevskia soli TaxID=418856 RepID=UPI0004A7108D|nr:phosphoribulokinase [Nevskia soli]
MSVEHPIIAVTGSSGAGTSTARRVFERIFDSLKLEAAYIPGDSFHAYDREQMRALVEKARIRGENFSHFGPGANLLDRLEKLFRDYGARGTGMVRSYLHTEAEAQEAEQPVGTFTPWTRLPPDTDVLFYEGLHGGVVTSEVNVARHVDLLIGVTPIVNLEWIQKIKRDRDERGQTVDDVTGTILRRLPDYVTYITPQFSRTDVNFQRVPLVDTSNPFVERDIPTAEESLVVISFRLNSRVEADIGKLVDGIPNAFLSRSTTVVVPGTEMEVAMEATLRPAVKRLAAARRKALKDKEKD